MKNLWSYILVLFLLACVNKSDEDNKNQPYFKFDEILHYSIDIDGDSVYSSASPQMEQICSIITGKSFRSLTDTLFIDEFDKMGFEKKYIDTTIHSSLEMVFSEKKVKGELTVHDCLPLYRDILIFKYENRITGFAKLCFECNQATFGGTGASASTFGHSGEWYVLKKLLNK